MRELVTTIGCLFFLYFHTFAQISVFYPNVDDWVRKNFAGKGVIIDNIKHGGNSNAIASFSSSKNVLKINKGIVISTGNAVSAIGPNDSYNISNDFDLNIQHDADLENIVKDHLYDISFIEFDFVSFQNAIKFNYQFASDEYPEYVGSSFNDIFAFFVSDGNISLNIALVPNKILPVSINTINDKTDSAFYINNNVFSQSTIDRNLTGTIPSNTKLWERVKSIFGKEAITDNRYFPDDKLIEKVNPDLYHYLQYDGITQKLTAQMFVEPYKKYHLKIIIADVADNIYDSAVFLESKSFTAIKDSTELGFKHYPDYSQIINPKLILEGKKLEDILPFEVKVPDATIYFDFDKSVIKPSEKNKILQLAQVYERIKANYKIEISGHTDGIGSLVYNLGLSQLRSNAVINELKKNIPNFSYDKVDFKAFMEPNCDNKTDEGRKCNRRVVIKFIKLKNG